MDSANEECKLDENTVGEDIVVGTHARRGGFDDELFQVLRRGIVVVDYPGLVDLVLGIDVVLSLASNEVGDEGVCFQWVGGFKIDGEEGSG